MVPFESIKTPLPEIECNPLFAGARQMIFTSASRNAVAATSSAEFVSATVGATGFGAGTGASAGVDLGANFVIFFDEDVEDATEVVVEDSRPGNDMDGNTNPCSTERVDEAAEVPEVTGCGIGASFATITMSAKKAMAATTPR
jgi:hypothetical protein